jgi:hypothetical protein
MTIRYGYLIAGQRQGDGKSPNIDLSGANEIDDVASTAYEPEIREVVYGDNISLVVAGVTR